VLEEEPDAGLGNGGLGRLAACFLDSMATMRLPAMGYGLRYEYGMFRQSIEDGWPHEQPDNWLLRPDPWEVARPDDKVEIRLNCSFEVRGGALRSIVGRPSTLIGIPFDRPVVGYGGKTINTLRLWGAGAADYFNFQSFSHGEFVNALAETLAAQSLTRVLYPDDSTTRGQGLRFVQEYFLVTCSLGDLVRRFRHTNADWSALPEKVAVQLNDTHPAVAVPELLRILLDEAHLGWDQAWDLTQRTLAYTNHTLLPEALERWPLAWFETLLPRHLEIIFEINRRLLDAVRRRFPGDDGRVIRTSLTISVAPLDRHLPRFAARHRRVGAGAVGSRPQLSRGAALRGGAVRGPRAGAPIARRPLSLLPEGFTGAGAGTGPLEPTPGAGPSAYTLDLQILAKNASGYARGEPFASLKTYGRTGPNRRCQRYSGRAGRRGRHPRRDENPRCGWSAHVCHELVGPVRPPHGPHHA